MVWPNAGSQIFLIHPDKPRITSCAAPRQINNNKKGLLEFRITGEVRPGLVGVVEMGYSGTVPPGWDGAFPTTTAQCPSETGWRRGKKDLSK